MKKAESKIEMLQMRVKCRDEEKLFMENLMKRLQKVQSTVQVLLL